MPILGGENRGFSFQLVRALVSILGGEVAIHAEQPEFFFWKSVRLQPVIQSTRTNLSTILIASPAHMVDRKKLNPRLFATFANAPVFSHHLFLEGEELGFASTFVIRAVVLPHVFFVCCTPSPSASSMDVLLGLARTTHVPPVFMPGSGKSKRISGQIQMTTPTDFVHRGSDNGQCVSGPSNLSAKAFSITPCTSSGYGYTSCD